MKRRKMIAGLGVLIGSGSLTLGSGAFSNATAERPVSVTFAPDSQDALLKLRPLGSDRVSSGTVLEDPVQFEFPGDGDTADGLGVDSVYEFDDDTAGGESGLLEITNQGTRTVEVAHDQAETDGPKIGLFDISAEPGPDGFRPTLSEVADGGNPVLLSPGDDVVVGVQIDTHGVEVDGGEETDGSYEEAVHIVASAPE